MKQKFALDVAVVPCDDCEAECEGNENWIWEESVGEVWDDVLQGNYLKLGYVRDLLSMTKPKSLEP